MHRSGLLTCLVAVGAMLLWSLGCQAQGQRSAPGALPTGLRTDVSPRLNASTYFAHGHLLERQGNFTQAAQQYRRALELTPDFVSARNRLGITLNKLGRHADASAELRQAIAEQPTAAYLHNNLGFSLYLQGRYGEAAEALQCALELNPAFRRARMNYGMVLGRLGLYAEALDEFRLASGEADAYYNVAVLQAEAGEYAAAAHSLETALQVKPDFDAAREQLHQVARLAAEAEPAPVEETAAAPDAPAADAELVSHSEPAGPAKTPTESEAPPPVQPATDPTPTELSAETAPAPATPIIDGAWLTIAFDTAEIATLLDELVTAAVGDAQAAYGHIMCHIEAQLAAMKPR